MRFFDRVAQFTPTVGQGTLTLGTAIGNAMLTLPEADAADGDEITFLLEEGDNFEISRGVVGGSGTTVTRDTVLKSKISGIAGTDKLDLAGTGKFRVVETAYSLNRFEDNIGYQALLPEIIKTAGWSAAPAEAGRMLVYNSAIGGTVTLPPVASSTDEVYHYRCANVGSLTIDGNGAETIEGAATLVLPRDRAVIVWANEGKTGWRAAAHLGGAEAAAVFPRGDVVQALTAGQKNQIKDNMMAGYAVRGPPIIRTTGGAYAPTAGCRAIIVEVQGAGGSGAASSNAGGAASAGGGGAEGGWAIKFIANPRPATITVGAGGTAPSAGANNGNTGGSSSYTDGTNTITANGGAGGVNLTSTNAAIFAGAVGLGGTASGGDINVRGSPGGQPIVAGGLTAFGGAGAGSRFGSGGAPNSATGSGNSNAGSSGTGYGSGSGGARNGSAGAQQPGVDGQPGVVIITELF